MLSTQLGRIRAGRTVLVGLVAVFMSLSIAASAMATPKGGFAVFADCPLKNASVNYCVYSHTTGGEVLIGTTSVPIEEKTPLTLQGGIIENEETEAETFVEAADGNTLSKTPLTVPGGLLGITPPESFPSWLKAIVKWFVETTTGVTATTELVNTPSISRGNLINEEGTAVTLPVRVHLNNALLGSSCYIGSKSNPVTIHLTTGTTSPPKGTEAIKGSVGELKFSEENEIITLTNNKLVDNTFSVPTAEGCGGILSFLIDPVIDLKLGLASPAGKNKAILNGVVETTSAAAVKAHE
jgi:hypothetical protein